MTSTSTEARMPVSAAAGRGTVEFVLHFARAYPGRTVAMIGLLMLAGLAEGLGLATLLPALELAVDPSRRDQSAVRLLAALGLQPTLSVLLVVIVIAIGLKSGFRWLAMKQVGYTLARVGKDLRVRLLRALMEVRWVYFTSQSEGHFANAVSTETYRATMAYRHACAALANSTQVLVYSAVIVVISWKLAISALLVGCLVALMLGRLIRLSRSAGREQTGVMKSLVAGLADAMKGVKPIKAMARESQFLSVLEEEAETLERAEQRQVVAQESLVSFYEPIIALMLALGIYAAIRWGDLAISGLLVTAFLFYRLTGRFQEVQREYQAATIGESAFWSLHTIVTEAEGQREERTGKRHIAGFHNEIRLDCVSFSYGDNKVLDEVSLTVPAGSLVAIVGSSGAGKTTIIDLLAGLHLPESGNIFVDGASLTDLDLAAWRRLIGYVPQETLLLHDTVYANVRLGNDNVGRDEVEAALRAADAWSFVSHLKYGLDTVIGERGLKLSGGQRQRISIARALLNRPLLLILDEATTALDPETEAAICRTLRELSGEVTVVSISHQEAMQNVADIIYEIRQGRLTVRRDARGSAETVAGLL